MKITTSQLVATLGLSLALLLGCQKEAAEKPPEAGELTKAQQACVETDGFENVLCTDPDVRKMDDDLARMVSRLVAHSTHDQQADVRAAQKSWEAKRDACMGLSPQKRRQCIDATYLARMNELQADIEDLP